MKAYIVIFDMYYDYTRILKVFLDETSAINFIKTEYDKNLCKKEDNTWVSVGDDFEIRIEEHEIDGCRPE